MPITAGCQDSSTGLTDGNIDMRPFEPNTLRGEGIDVRGEAGHFAAETADRITVEVVSGEEKNVEISFWRPGSSGHRDHPK